MRAALVALVLAVSTPAVADDAGKPWTAGISETEQQAALALYRAGNTEFEESRYPQALAQYREALKHWDHPGIRFNMAVCLVNLDQPLEAMTHLEAALKYGAAPLGDEAYAQGLTYLKLLQAQISTLTVTCDAAGAEVTLDGQKLLACPGSETRRVAPGEHQLVTAKPGFLTDTQRLVALPGKALTHAIKLTPLDAVRTKVVRRWNARTPWIVTGVGVGTVALGSLALYLSKNEYETYDELLAQQCPDGCGPSMPAGMQEVSSSVKAHESRGATFNITGIGLVVIGGAAIIGGLVGVYLNQPRTVAETPVVTPTVGPNGAGASVHWRW